MKRFLFAMIVASLGMVLFAPFVTCSSAEEDRAEESPLASAVIIAEQIEDGVRKTSMFLKIADEYAKAGAKDKALEVLSRALEAAQGVEYPLHRAQALAEVAEKFAQAGEKDKATEILSQALEVARGIKYPVYRAEALAEIAVRYARVGKRDKALQTLFQAREAGKKIKNLRLEVEAWINILVKYVEIGEYGIALSFATAARDATFKANTLIKIATKCAELGDKDKALEALSLAHEAAKEITHPPYKAGRLRKIAAKYAEYGEKDKQQEVLSQAFEAAKTIEDPVYKARVLTNIAVKYAQAGDKDNASKTLFEAFQVAKIIESPDDKFRRLLRIANKFAEYEEKDKASEVLYELLQLVITTEPPEYKPGELLRIAEKYAEYGEKDKALEVLPQALEAARAIEAKTLEFPFDKVDDLVEVAAKYTEYGEKDKALEVLSEALEAAETIKAKTIEDSDEKFYALAEVAVKYAEAGEKDKALEVLSQAQKAAKRMIFPPLKDEALSEIAVAYTEVGEFSQALELFKKIESDSEKGWALAEIAEDYAEVDEYEELLKLVGTIEDSYSGDWALARIAVKYAEAGQYDQALKLLGTTKDSYHRDNALAEVAVKYAEAGQYDEALKLVSTIEKGHPEERALADYHIQSALAEIAGMCAKAAKEDKPSEVLSRAFERAKTIEDAREKEESAEARAWKTYVLVYVAGKYAEDGEYTRALETAKRIEEPFFQAWALAEIGLKCAEAGEKDKASEMLSQALEQAKGVEEACDKAEVLLEISDKYTEAGEKVDERASKILAEIIREEEQRQAPETKVLKIDEEVQKNVEEFFEKVVTAPKYSGDPRLAYKKIAGAIWKARSRAELDQYEFAIREHPSPKEDSRRKWVQDVLEEIQRARAPRGLISEGVRINAQKFFGERRGDPSTFAEFLSFVHNLGDERIVREYATAIRQHPWPPSDSKGEIILYSGGDRHQVEFVLYFLEHPGEREAYFQRLEVKKSGQFETSPVVYYNIEEFFEELNKAKAKGYDVFDYCEVLFDYEEYTAYQYVKAFEGMELPPTWTEEDREDFRDEISDATEEVEECHFDLEAIMWAGFPEYRERAKQDVQKFQEELMQAEHTLERNKAAENFLNKVEGEKRNIGLLYEYLLAYKYLPIFRFGKNADATNKVYEKLSGLIEEAVSGELLKLADEFLKGIASNEPLERKEVVLKVIPTFPPRFENREDSKELLSLIQEHPWPEDKSTKKKIEMIVELMEEVSEFFSKDWPEVSSPSGKAEETPEEMPTMSQRLVMWTHMAMEDKFKVDHWPSIIRDKKRPLLHRFWAAYYLRFYSLGLSQIPTTPDFSELSPEEISEADKMIVNMKELGQKLNNEVKMLLAEEDETVTFLLELQGTKGPDALIRTLMKALESDYLYFRILSQKRLEGGAKQEFPLDPTDPAELRAPAIKQWQKWWEENKDKLHYDPMRRRLVQ